MREVVRLVRSDQTKLQHRRGLTVTPDSTRDIARDQWLSKLVAAGDKLDTKDKVRTAFIRNDDSLRLGFWRLRRINQGIQFAHEGLPILLGYGIAGGVFHSDAPAFALRHLNPQRHDIAFSGFAGKAFSHFPDWPSRGLVEQRLPPLWSVEQSRWW
jgi:hypothetical protein